MRAAIAPARPGRAAPARPASARRAYAARAARSFPCFHRRHPVRRGAARRRTGAARAAHSGTAPLLAGRAAGLRPPSCAAAARPRRAAARAPARSKPGRGCCWQGRSAPKWGGRAGLTPWISATRALQTNSAPTHKSSFGLDVGQLREKEKKTQMRPVVCLCWARRATAPTCRAGGDVLRGSDAQERLRFKGRVRVLDTSELEGGTRTRRDARVRRALAPPPQQQQAAAQHSRSRQPTAASRGQPHGAGRSSAATAPRERGGRRLAGRPAGRARGRGGPPRRGRRRCRRAGGRPAACRQSLAGSGRPAERGGRPGDRAAARQATRQPALAAASQATRQPGRQIGTRRGVARARSQG
jgi:hypothetical protein